MALYFTTLASVREDILLVIAPYATLLCEELGVLPRSFDGPGTQVDTDVANVLLLVEIGTLATLLL